MSAPIRIGVIGLGMGKTHAQACLDLPGVELAAIAEPNAARRDEFATRIAERLGAKAGAAVRKIPLYDDYRDMVRKAGLDGVVIALPTDLHFPATAFSLKQGVAVLCEKPPTCNGAEMVKLAKLARDRGLTYMFCRQQRFDPAKFAVRELIAKDKLGAVYHAESKWMRTRWIPWRGGWGVNQDRGGGVLLDLGIHQLDDAWFTMGCPRPVDVSAAMHCAFSHLAKGRKDLSLPYNADDNTVALVRFANGATLSMMVTFAANTVDQPRLGTDGEISERVHWVELSVLGSKAGVDVQRQRLIGDRGADAVHVGPLPIPARIARMKTGINGQMADFTTAIRTGRDPLNTAEQAAQLMQMLDAIRRSATTGRSVTIKES